ncbi:MAG: hypothetical protein ACHQT7_00630 [Candidatus Levyibacteriota bacterium]
MVQRIADKSRFKITMREIRACFLYVIPSPRILKKPIHRRKAGIIKIKSFPASLSRPQTKLLKSGRTGGRAFLTRMSVTIWKTKIPEQDKSA